MSDKHGWSCTCGHCPDPESREVAKARARSWHARWGCQDCDWSGFVSGAIRHERTTFHRAALPADSGATRTLAADVAAGLHDQPHP